MKMLKTQMLALWVSTSETACWVHVTPSALADIMIPSLMILSLAILSLADLPLVNLPLVILVLFIMRTRYSRYLRCLDRTTKHVLAPQRPRR
jgi:hypothetical protein